MGFVGLFTLFYSDRLITALHIGFTPFLLIAGIFKRFSVATSLTSTGSAFLVVVELVLNLISFQVIGQDCCDRRVSLRNWV